MKFSIFLVAGFGFALSSSVAAEEKKPEIPLFSVESRFFPSLHLRDPHANTFEEDARLNVDDVQTKVTLPFRIHTDTLHGSVTFGYESLRFDFRHWDKSAAPTAGDQFHALQLSFFFRKKLKKEKWTMNSFVTPGMNSDFKAVTTRDLRLQGGVVFVRSEFQRNWSFGAVFINDYGRPRAFPAVGFDGRVGKKQTLTVRLPVLVSWGYEASEKSEVGLAARIAGNNFHVNREGAFNNKTVRYSVGMIGPYWKWKPRSSLAVVLDSGITFRHQLEYFDGKNRMEALKFEPGPFVAAAIRFVH